MTTATASRGTSRSIGAESFVDTSAIHRRLPLHRETLIFWLLLGLCPIVAAIGPGTISEAQTHARTLLDIEATLGVRNETSFHLWLAAQPTLHTLTNLVYIGAHVSAVVALLLWTWVRRPGRFPLVRNTFAGTQITVVIGYLLYPTTPPRLLPDTRVGNTLVDAVGISSAGFAEHVQYTHAAFPSGHVAFATVVAIGVFQAHAPRPILIFGAAYPGFVTWMVVATGNHYWLDAIAGCAVAASVSVIATRVANRHSTV